MIEAQSRGFDNCLLRDALGNVAELATANVFLAKDGIVFTPTPNGTFLNGITRQRVTRLLRDAGVTVIEQTLTYADFQNADEIFSSGNFSKLSPITRIDERTLAPGPILPPGAPAVLGFRARFVGWVKLVAKPIGCVDGCRKQLDPIRLEGGEMKGWYDVMGGERGRRERRKGREKGRRKKKGKEKRERRS